MPIVKTMGSTLIDRVLIESTIEQLWHHGKGGRLCQPVLLTTVRTVSGICTLRRARGCASGNAPCLLAATFATKLALKLVYISRWQHSFHLTRTSSNTGSMPGNCPSTCSCSFWFTDFLTATTYALNSRDQPPPLPKSQGVALSLPKSYAPLATGHKPKGSKRSGHILRCQYCCH